MNKNKKLKKIGNKNVTKNVRENNKKKGIQNDNKTNLSNREL